jgi:hypothetical protein
MSDEKVTKGEREYHRLHELEHILYAIERTIIQQVGPRSDAQPWKALDVLRDSLLFTDQGQVRPRPKKSIVDYANMTAWEIFEELDGAELVTSQAKNQKNSQI